MPLVLFYVNRVIVQLSHIGMPIYSPEISYKFLYLKISLNVKLFYMHIKHVILIRHDTTVGVLPPLFYSKDITKCKLEKVSPLQLASLPYFLKTSFFTIVTQPVKGNDTLI